MMRSVDCMATTNAVVARHVYGRINRGHHLAVSKTRTVNWSFVVNACLTESAVDTLLCPRIRGFVSFCVLPDDTLRHRDVVSQGGPALLRPLETTAFGPWARV